MSRRRATRKQADSQRSPPSAADVQPWQWFLLAAAAPLAMCAAKLNLDLWHDEIYTLVEFVSGGPAKIATDYSAPNNHVLYSLLLWPFHLISNSSFVLRLPSFGFAAGALWWTFRAGCRLGDLRTGVLATVLLGLNQMFLIHVMQVRGYGLSMFLFTWLVNLAISEKGPLRLSRLLQIAVVGAAFLYVMPTNLLFFLPLAAFAVAWAVWPPKADDAESPAAASEHASPTRRVVLCAGAWAAAVGLAAMCYAPIAQQVLRQRGAPTVFSTAGLFASIKNFLQPAQHDYLLLIPLFVLGLILWGMRRVRGTASGSSSLPVLAAGCFGAAFLLAAALGISPFPRNFCPLLPLMALAEAWMLGELARSVPWKGPAAESQTTLAAALVAAAVLAPQLRTYSDRLAAYCLEHPGAHDGYFNYYAADYRPSAVVERISELTADDRPFRVYYADEDHWNLIYYFQRAGQRLAGGGERSADSRASVYVIAPARPDWHAIAGKCGLPEETLRALPELDGFGYYRLYQSPHPLPIGDDETR